MGVDPGTAVTGYAFLEERAGRITVLEYGVVRSRASDPLPRRLEKIYRELGALIDTYNPKVLALARLRLHDMGSRAVTTGTHI
jgi:crossover junction endodeoxyribonuclease RuvC